jgi:hypothetical protein
MADFQPIAAGILEKDRVVARPFAISASRSSRLGRHAPQKGFRDLTKEAFKDLIATAFEMR